MADNASFLRLCASTIGNTYKGDPLELHAFINSVELLKEIAEAGQANLLYKFLKSRLADWFDYRFDVTILKGKN